MTMDDPAEQFKRFEADGWSGKAETYAGLTGALTKRAIGPLLGAVRVSPGSRLLDVATGPGYVAAAAVALGAEAVGVDIAPGMLEVARRENPGIEFLHGDAEELPFADASFDAVAANFVINHLPRPERAAAEFARVLRPGGRAAFSVWDDDERNRWYGVAGEAIAAAGEAREGAIPDGAPDPTRFADPTAARALLAEAGLGGFGMEHLEFTWPAESEAALWDALLAGSVRTAARIQAQDPEGRERVRQEFLERAEEFRRGDRLELVASVKIARGELP